MKNRTTVDFSKHIVLETHYKNDNHNIDIWDLKLPNSNFTHRVRFVNTCGVLTISGDFGNWVFCREFHPSKDREVSDGYWNEKISILSQQVYALFDGEKTKKLLRSEIKSGLSDYGYSGQELKEAKQFFNHLLQFTEDETEYAYEAFRGSEKPSFLDYVAIPFGKSQHRWLDVVYDAFDELCRRESLTTGDGK